MVSLVAGFPAPIAAAAIALIFVSFAHSGWNAAAHLGSEIILFSIKSRPVTALTGLGTFGVGLLVCAFFQRKQSVRSGAVPLEAVHRSHFQKGHR
jgi:hypothetical protein